MRQCRQLAAEPSPVRQPSRRRMRAKANANGRRDVIAGSLHLIHSAGCVKSEGGPKIPLRKGFFLILLSKLLPGFRAPELLTLDCH